MFPRGFINQSFLLLSHPFRRGVNLNDPVQWQTIDHLEGIGWKGLTDHSAHLLEPMFGKFTLDLAYNFFTAKDLL